MRVLKFGGSSVASAERIQKVGHILANYAKQNIAFTTVFSAFGGVTDDLIDMASKAARGKAEYTDVLNAVRQRHLDCINSLFTSESDAKAEVLDQVEQNFSVLKDLLLGVFLVREASLRTMDYVLSFGERNSAFVISEYLKTIGLRTSFLDARQIIKTNKSFGSAAVHKDLTYQLISEYYQTKPSDTHIVTGFVSSAKGGLTTTLGRGGSDYTAALIGAALDAEIIEIWTDVNGVLTCDPRTVPQAFTIPKISYNEAYEMSHFGAKVIYPPTIKPAHEMNIPLRIKNTFNPDHPGTLVSHETTEYKKPVKGVSSIKEVCLLTLQGSGLIGVPGISGRLFHSLAIAKVNIILITQGSSEHSISFAIAPLDVSAAKEAVDNEFKKEIINGTIDPIKVEKDLSVLAIIGENMRFVPGIAAKMLWALGHNGINASAIAQGSSELNISVVVDSADKNKGLLALHEAFFLSEYRVINVFMVGVGLIGSTLLEQMYNQINYLKTERKIVVKIIGLANSRKMIFDDQGIDLSLWKEKLNASEITMNIESFVERIVELNLNNSVFIDNTADLEIPNLYKILLSNNISVCTPNKVAASSTFNNYRTLKNLALENNVSYGYETNVGAGLPVISTIQALIDSGDKIYRIEAVLSGSLSFIFNNFLSEKRFSDIVREAKQLGYTEPDPRLDLFGTDVKRKLIILSREAQYSIENDDVSLTPFLPEVCTEADGVDDFLKSLDDENDYFETIKSRCREEKLKPVFLAKLNKGVATVSLEYVGVDSPFYSLQGSDNMIAIYSKRYAQTPLLVRGPGAGAEVTAAGLFAEVISIANKNFSI